jgi:large subunit ribosomal protein L23
MMILKKPLITEKMTKISEKLNRFGFIVDGNANKVQIKQAVEKMYNVTVESVNTINVASKRKQRYTKTGFVSGSTGTYKKAVVTLKKGDTIDFYSNI